MKVVSWKEFRPNSDSEILDHYYQVSPGMQSGVAKLIGKVNGWIRDLVGKAAAQASDGKTEGTEEFGENMIGGGFSGAIADLTSNSPSTRKFLDSKKEKERILSTYRDSYGRDDFGISGAENFDNDKLQWLIGEVGKGLEEIVHKCSIKDSAGCRYFGVRFAALTYLMLVAEARNVEVPSVGSGVLGDTKSKGGGVFAGFMSRIKVNQKAELPDSALGENAVKTASVGGGVLGWVMGLGLLSALAGMFFKSKKSKY